MEAGPAAAAAAVHQLHDVREMEYGTLESVAMDTYVMKEIKRISQEWRSGNVGHKVGGPSGESPAGTAARAAAALTGLVQQDLGGEQQVLVVVAHSHVNKALLAAALPASATATATPNENEIKSELSTLLPGGMLPLLHDIPWSNCGTAVLDYDPHSVPAFNVLAVNLKAGGSAATSESRTKM